MCLINISNTVLRSKQEINEGLVKDVRLLKRQRSPRIGIHFSETMKTRPTSSNFYQKLWKKILEINNCIQPTGTMYCPPTQPRISDHSYLPLARTKRLIPGKDLILQRNLSYNVRSSENVWSLFMCCHSRPSQ